MKISKIFEKIELNNIYYENVKIKKFSFFQNRIKLSSNNIILLGFINPKQEKTTFNIKYLTYQNYSIKDIIGEIEYKDNIKINTIFYFQDFKYKLNALLKNNTVYGKLQSLIAQIQYNHILLKTKNLFSNFSYHLKNKKFNIDMKLENTKIYKDKTIIFTKNSKIKIDNKKISGKLFKTNINTPEIKIYSDNSNFTYFFDSYLFLRAFENKIKYKQNNINLKKIDLTFKSLNNLNALLLKSEIKNNFKIKSEKCLVIIFNKFKKAICSKDYFSYPPLKLITESIHYINDIIKAPVIKGKYKKLNLLFKNTVLNLNRKTLKIDYAYINKLKIYDIFANTKDFKTYNASLKTDFVINHEFKNILKEFNVNIPFTQIKGINHLKTDIIYNNPNKKIDINAKLFSKNSIIKYENLLISSDKILINYKYPNNFAKFDIKNMYLPYNDLKLITSFNGTFFNNKYINIFAKIDELKYSNFLFINNFNEKIAADIKKQIIYFINLAIMGDLSNKRIYFYSLKPIIKYTPFSGIITNGNAVLNFFDDSIMLLLTLDMTKPLILNNKPKPNSVFVIIESKKDNIHIHNAFADVKINNLEKLNAEIKNAEINVNMIFDIVNTITPLVSKKKKSTSKFLAKIIGLNTNFIYNKHKFLSEKFVVHYDKEINLTSTYKQSKLLGYTKHKYFLLSGENYTKKELVPLLDFFNHFESINLDFVLVKSPDDFYTGKVYINSGIVKDLKALNNIIAFLNTIPSLLSLKSPGFSAKGYKIKKGFINYLYYKNILYFKQIEIKGVNIDFDGKGYVDFSTQTIHLKITAHMKLNIKKIPIIGKGLSYLLFGKNRTLDVKIVVSGKLEDPKVSQDIGKSIIESPFLLFKRAITLPFNLF